MKRIEEETKKIFKKEKTMWMVNKKKKDLFSVVGF